METIHNYHMKAIKLLTTFATITAVSGAVIADFDFSTGDNSATLIDELSSTATLVSSSYNSTETRLEIATSSTGLDIDSATAGAYWTFTVSLDDPTSRVLITGIEYDYGTYNWNSYDTVFETSLYFAVNSSVDVADTASTQTAGGRVDGSTFTETVATGPQYLADGDTIEVRWTVADYFSTTGEEYGSGIRGHIFTGLRLNGSVVPEPSGALLVGLGALTLLTRNRKK